MPTFVIYRGVPRRSKIIDEFQDLDLGDARRNRRAVSILESLARNPRASFPEALGSVAAREAFYRLVNNDAVELAQLVAPHTAQTVARAAQDSERPIVAIDKTTFMFVGAGDREDLERVSHDKSKFDAFVAFAVSASRRSHGVLAIETLEGHGRTDADDWSAFVNQAGSALEEADARPIYVMDREANAYTLYSALMAENRDFVVRASTERKVKATADGLRESLAQVAARAPRKLTRSVRLSRRKDGGRPTRQRMQHPTRQAREAVLSIRATTISVPRSTSPVAKRAPDALVLNLVHVVEEHPPKGQDAVEWVLLTNLPIDTVGDVERVVDAYRARWMIEEYFKALKTGCNYEARQLESRHALENALAFAIPIAWRLLELRRAAEEEENAPASNLLEADEVHVLRKLSKDVKLGKAPTAWEALLAVASIGGHIRQNGRPGWQVLYAGFKKLQSNVEGYRLAKAEM